MAPDARLLVADDEPSVAMTMQAILEQEGYHVETALHAADVRRLLAQERFDAALLDLRFDDADGLDVLAELKRRQPHCEAIMLTGYASLESAVRAIRHGAYDYLVKPCDLDELKLTIARAVERGAMARALRERLAELEQANATIRGFADELQQRVDKATAALHDKVQQLSEATRRLEETQRQRDQFISMIAHELAQPLTNISGYAQILARGSATPEVEERARATILSETRRLARLVQDLGDMARLSAGRFRVSRAACDLAEIAHQQVELARIGAERHTIRLVAPPGPVPAECDRDRVAQVLSNLLTNALKYTPGGEIRVKLGVEDGHARVSVSDEGSGIPPDRLESIFDAHVRLADDEESREPKAQGAGLGLYIVKGIVEAHGGRIVAESEAGKGSTFTLWLPLPQQ